MYAAGIPELDFWAWLALLFAPFVGSFIALVSVREPAGEQWITGRSRCRTCNRPLSLSELLPIVSALAQKGHCRCGKVVLSRRYLLLEAGCLAASLWSVAHFAGLAVLVTAVLGWWLLALSVIDLEHFWLPDGLTLPLIPGGLAVTYAFMPDMLLHHVLGAAIGYLALTGVAWLYARTRRQQGLGDGDPRLFAAAGAWVGWAGLPMVLLLAAVAGLLAAVVLRLRGRELSGQSAIAFGPYLALGLWLTWLYAPLG